MPFKSNFFVPKYPDEVSKVYIPLLGNVHFSIDPNNKNISALPPKPIDNHSSEEQSIETEKRPRSPSL